VTQQPPKILRVKSSITNSNNNSSANQKTYNTQSNAGV